LVVRALELLRQRSGCELGAEVELAKRIPVAAGLGGGSSDAATALKLANSAWDLSWSIDRLAAVAAEIGSDVPFFLYGGPAVCRGRGEFVEKVPATLPVHFVVVRPPIGLSTGEVYAFYDSLPESMRPGGNPDNQLAAFCRELISGRISAWGQIIHNSLQAAARHLSVWVERLITVFDQLDFVGHQLSGSGSALTQGVRPWKSPRFASNSWKSPESV
jgi:4-diphosphocytidyl-2-C-methyl-D-erythritol kinase